MKQESRKCMRENYLSSNGFLLSSFSSSKAWVVLCFLTLDFHKTSFLSDNKLFFGELFLMGCYYLQPAESELEQSILLIASS